MIPNMFEWVETIPLNSNGKVDIDSLPISQRIRPELKVDFKAPQTKIEREIAAVWQEFLPVSKVGIEDNFFDLGGQSLLLTQVQSRLNKMYRKELTIIDLFRYPTIHSLVLFINEGETHDPDSHNKIKERAVKQREMFRSLHLRSGMGSGLKRRKSG
jgi:acyl carrier protein